MFFNMVCLLIEYKCINIIIVKVKVLCVYVELFIIKFKDDFIYFCCMVFFYLKSKEVVIELFWIVVLKVVNCLGGYICIICIGYCLGDNVEMCLIEFVDFNEIYGVGEVKKIIICCLCCGGSIVLKVVFVVEEVMEVLVIEEIVFEVVFEEVINDVFEVIEGSEENKIEE